MKSTLRDPRIAQITVLGSLACFGIGSGLFGFSLPSLTTAITSALVTQWVCSRRAGIRFDPKSALISGISLGLLLRSNYLWLIALGGVLSISSKFILRANHKHIFNPTNFGITVLLLATDQVWVSPGQWGSGVILATLTACAGMLVVFSAARSDVTYAFLAAHAGSLLARAIWLGDPFEITLHQLESGALIIFAFFMISDPKTTPDTRSGRIIFACAVAALAYFLRFQFYLPEALFYALFAVSAVTPIVDRILPGRRYQWPDIVISPQPLAAGGSSA